MNRRSATRFVHIETSPANPLGIFHQATLAVASPRVRRFLLAVLLLSLVPRPAAAQAFGQYLVILDDSGSMDGSDPRRLAVMASMALAGALEDGDQVMLVGMNELAAGGSASFVSPRALLPGRDRSGVVSLAGERFERLGTHHGETPCRASLEAARRLLESASSAGAPQTLLMLTDGACNGGAVEAPHAWLDGLTSHREGRFRFVLLMRRGRDRPDRQLVAYASDTGWTGETRVEFDARSLVHAFGQVLAFSRGLLLDEGGHVGVERTFAGARVVRALAIRDRGDGDIEIERVSREGEGSPVAGGATFRSSEHAWSFRGASLRPMDDPFAIRASGEGVDVLAIPIYGRLMVEAVVAPCGADGAASAMPPLPWTAEVAVRAGQPACAWARLVGDAGETITPLGSFDFGMSTCGASPEREEAGCDASPMQPAGEGIFEAQLGASFEPGRYRLVVRASGGALAREVEGERGFSAMRFGVERVTTTTEPERPLSAIDLGRLPEPSFRDLALRYRGAFPADARAGVRCEVEASAAATECVVCEITSGDSVVLEDDLELHVRVGARPFCAAVSAEGRALPITFRVVVDPEGDTLGVHTLPLRAELSYAELATLSASVTGGSSSETELEVPGPVAQSSVELRVEGAGDDVVASDVHLLARADEHGHIRVPLSLLATDCCSAGTREATLVLSAEGSELRVPLSISVEDPGFWICPGKQIAMAIAGVLLLLLLLWVIHGFMSPARFSRGALLLYASTLEELQALREGDDGWRELRRFGETERGFRRPAAVWLGGPRAPLPSLRRQAADGRIEALGSGSAQLVVSGPTVERWNELEARWDELSPGTYPVAGAVRLRRGEDFVMEFRR